MPTSPLWSRAGVFVRLLTREGWCHACRRSGVEVGVPQPDYIADSGLVDCRRTWRCDPGIICRPAAADRRAHHVFTLHLGLGGAVAYLNRSRRLLRIWHSRGVPHRMLALMPNAGLQKAATMQDRGGLCGDVLESLLPACSIPDRVVPLRPDCLAVCLPWLPLVSRPAALHYEPRPVPPERSLQPLSSLKL